MKNKSIILLSGGLDSAVSLAACKDDIGLALFFDYGQKAFSSEKIAVENLCRYYNIKLEIIALDWLKNITNTSLVNDSNEIPALSEQDAFNKDVTTDTMKSVWIPNRNALFINIAAAYADSFGYEKIIIGANKEEAGTFSDNSKEFIESITKTLKFSTLVKPQVVAPLINMNKKEIISLGKELNLPFRYVWSCYTAGEKHCGRCESCVRLKLGLESAGLFDILNILFVN